MRSRTLLIAVFSTLSLAWTNLPSSVSPETRVDTPSLEELQSTHASVAAADQGAFIVSSSPFYDAGGWVSGYMNYAASLNRDGLLSPESKYVGSGSPAAVASSGDGYLVAWRTGNGTHLLRYTKDGAMIDEQPIVLADGEVTDIAWTGNEYFVVRAASSGHVATRVAEDGRVLQQIPVRYDRIASRNGVSVLAGSSEGTVAVHTLLADVLGDPASIGTGAEVAIAAGDPGFLVTWRAGSAIVGRLLDPSGRPDGSPFVIAGNGTAAAPVWTGQRWLVAFESNGSIRAVHAAPGAVGQPLLISQAGRRVSVAANASTVYVVWEEEMVIRSATVIGTEITRTGPVHRVRTTQSRHVMATVGGATLLAWNDGSTRVRRMDGQAPTHSITQPGSPSALASRGSEALLVLETYGTRSLLILDHNGATKSTTSLLRPGTGWRDAAAAWVGDSYLVVWPQRSARGGYQLFGVRVSAEGTLLGTPRPFGNEVGAFDVSIVAAGDTALVRTASSMALLIKGETAIDAGLLPATSTVATDGTDFLITRLRREASGDVLEWSRLLRNGQRTGDSTLSLGQRDLKLQTFWTGENYLAVLLSATTRIDFSALRLAPDGTRIDDAPIPLVSAFTGSPAWNVALSLRGPSAIDFTYFLYDDAASAPRLVFRSLLPASRRRAIR